MFEKVNPSHPDKIADRIAGAMVDLAYQHQDNPKIAVEVLIGHGQCTIITESTYHFSNLKIKDIVNRIAEEKVSVTIIQNQQNEILNANQQDGVKCGDNGIFKGMPITAEQKFLATMAANIYEKYPYDGKYILDGVKLVICQSHAEEINDFPNAIVNPLGYWTGGVNVDSGATNRKLGSDMGDAITGGGLHGKDLSKADVSVNIVCHILAQEYQVPVVASCAIGDENIVFRYNGQTNTLKYSDVVAQAKKYVDSIGGFEKLAEWGLI